MNRSAGGVRLATLAAVLASFASAGSLAAQGISPTGTFGSQPTFTFGGTDIPNNAVMTNSNAGSLGVILGLTATQRFNNPALTNDGAGTFFAQPGIDANAPSGPTDPYALWNFDFFVGGDNAANFTYELLYDFDPGFGTAQADLGSLDPVCIDEIIGCLEQFPPSFPVQDSWNLGMDFLSEPIFITPPTFSPFDPTASGEYTFALLAFDANENEVARSSINVDVGSAAVPEPATMSMLAFGLVGLAGVGRRRKKRSI
ncbi:MAG TPA: PEP-CTERM sorting domain-containing protein [Gemmatimonadales bacterium]|jgi:hypothetical protein